MKLGENPSLPDLNAEALAALETLPRQPEEAVMEHGVTHSGWVNINAEGGARGIQVPSPNGKITFIPGSVSGNATSFVILITNSKGLTHFSFNEQGTVFTATTAPPENPLADDPIEDITLLESDLVHLGSLPIEHKKLVILGAD